MPFDRDQRFSREIRAAGERFDVEHANYPPWSDEISEPVGCFVIKDGGFQAHQYVERRDGVKIDGMGEIGGQDVLTVRVA